MLDQLKKEKKRREIKQIINTYKMIKYRRQQIKDNNIKR